MNAIELLEQRRSVRNYKEEKVPRELISEIVSLSRFAPSWANTQIVRYNVIDNRSIIKEIADSCVKGFIYNTKTLKKANGVVVLSYIQGKSGVLEGKVDSTDNQNSDTNHWECFDAGIACQQFCLAAYAKGVSTCILGIINNDAIARKINLPADEKVAALIVYGYEAGEHHKAPNRMAVEEVLRFVDKAE